MKSKKLIIATLFSVFSISTWANFSGQWSGQGQIEFSSNKTVVPCSSFYLNTEHYSRALSIETLNMNCGGIEMNLEFIQIAIVRNPITNVDELKVEGLTVGTISDTQLEAQWYDEAYQITHLFKLTKTDENTVSFSDTLLVDDKTYGTIQATLNKK